MDNGEGSGDQVRNGEIEPQPNNGQDVSSEFSHEPSFETDNGSTGQDHVQKHGPIDHDHLQEDGPMDKDHCEECIPKVDGYVQEEDSMGQPDGHTGQDDGSKKQLEKSISRIGDIDTTAPFESVKEAVSMFSSIVDWKAHKVQMAERRKRAAQELRKAQEEIPLLKKKSEAAEESKQQVLKELENAKRCLEELKLNVERGQTEESQAKQDEELSKLRVEEIEQGVSEESSVAAKRQLEVARARHQAAVSELMTVKVELENIEKDYASLVVERDLAIQKEEEAVSSSIETEKNVEDLTIKLITIKEALESAHGEYLEAEEDRTEREQDSLDEEQVSEEECQVAETEDLKLKLDAAAALLQDLEAEVASYMGGSHKDILSAVDLAKTDLEEVKKDIANVTNEVNDLKIYEDSLNSELEQEKATLVAVKQSEWIEARIMEALEADLMRTVCEVTVSEMTEKAARWKSVTQLEMASEETEQAKARVEKAQKELKKAKKAARKAKKRENKIMGKVNLSGREVEAARASERFAHGAVTAVEESESVISSESEPESSITLSVEKYQELSRKGKDAEDEANERVSEAISQIDLAKKSEREAVKRLEVVKCDRALKKEELSSAMQKKAERAKEGKLVVEREVRIWRSEKERRRKAEECRKKKKRWFIPRMCMFLCRKKGRHSSKNST